MNLRLKEARPSKAQAKGLTSDHNNTTYAANSLNKGQCVHIATWVNLPISMRKQAAIPLRNEAMGTRVLELLDLLSSLNLRNLLHLASISSTLPILRHRLTLDAANVHQTLEMHKCTSTTKPPKLAPNCFLLRERLRYLLSFLDMGHGSPTSFSSNSSCEMAFNNLKPPARHVATTSPFW